MTPQEIRDAIAASPELLALQASGNLQGIADSLSSGRVRIVARMVSARGLAERVPGGPLAAEVILMKLEGARDAMLTSQDASTRVLGSLLRRQLGFLAADGLDFGSPALRSMLDQLAQQGVLTAAEAAGLKAIAESPDTVAWQQVRAAITEA